MSHKVKQLVILSGKGGTGKTSVTATFAHLAATGNPTMPVVLADADVDASNLELVLNPAVQEKNDFRAGEVAIIAPEKCTACGVCAEVCRYDAVRAPKNGDENYTVDPIDCEGCAACFYRCPAKAIHMEEQLAGYWFRSDSDYGPLYHAALRPAQENSGKLVTMVKQNAMLRAMEDEYGLVIVDGPPGIGCPVISASTGADLVLIVTEPSAAGAHDLDRVLRTVEHFGIPARVCVNKADLHSTGTRQIEQYCHERDVAVVGHIPFDITITEAMAQGQPVTQYRADSAAAAALHDVWREMREIIAGL